jgi:hypothetical protein
VLDRSDEGAEILSGSEAVSDARRRMSAFARVKDTAQRLNCDWRTAAQATAIARMAQAAELRSIYP